MVKTVPRKPYLQLTINYAEKRVEFSAVLLFFSQNFRILFSEIFAFIFMRNFLTFFAKFRISYLVSISHFFAKPILNEVPRRKKQNCLNLT